MIFHAHPYHTYKCNTWISEKNNKIDCLAETIQNGSVWDIFLESSSRALFAIKVLSLSDLMKKSIPTIRLLVITAFEMTSNIFQ